MFNIVLEVLASAKRQGKGVQVIQMGKGEIKLFPFADNKKTLAALTSEFREAAGCKANGQN